MPAPRRQLRPQAEREQALEDHIETTHYFDEETGELYEPSTPPGVPAGEEGEDDYGPEA